MPARPCMEVNETPARRRNGETRYAEELANLLGHVDQRVRLAAQMALGTRTGGAAAFKTVATDPQSPHLARLHAVWGLGQIGRCRSETDCRHRGLDAVINVAASR